MQRFLDKANVHSRILNEIKSGKKRTHWMWYAFPQLECLGVSQISKHYAIKDKAQAKEFCEHNILERNLRELCNELLKLKTNSSEEVFGYIDSMKLKSSMTLFYTATNDEIYKRVLDKFYNGEFCENSKV